MTTNSTTDRSAPNTLRRARAVVYLIFLGGLAGILLLPRFVSSQSVTVSATDIMVDGSPVLTEASATPLYARGTGIFRPANRLVRLGETVFVNDGNRGLTLTLLNAATHSHISSTNFDTWNSTVESDALAAALRALDNTKICILTSYDAFEGSITAGLRDEARRLGLTRLAESYPGSLVTQSTWRHPYAAIFYGAAWPTENHHVIEVLQPNETSAPFAILATWLIDDGFVGQSLSPTSTRRVADPPCSDDSGNIFVDCGNGTVTDNRTGLVWLADAFCIGATITWYEATEFAAGLSDLEESLSSFDCGLSDGSLPGDWRLPSLSEWLSMISNALGAPGEPDCTATPPTITNDTGEGCWASGPSSFANVIPTQYWSSTNFGPGGGAIDLNIGAVGAGFLGKSDRHVLWLVRDGR